MRLGVHVCAQYLWSDRGASRHDSLVSMHLMFFRVEGSICSVCISPVHLGVALCVTTSHTVYGEDQKKHSSSSSSVCTQHTYLQLSHFLPSLSVCAQPTELHAHMAREGC